MTDPPQIPAHRRPPSLSGPRLPHMPALDGLRAIALVTVLCFHGGFAWVSGGYLPLTSFFVLSGFLITALLLVERDRSGGVALARFWGRRARRLVPAAVLGVALAGVFAAAAGTPEQVDNLRGDAVAAFANVANWRFVLADQVYGDLFAQPSPLQHYWSLAVEEQFYLLFPLVVAGALAIGRGRRWALAIGLGAGVVASTLLMRALHHPGDPPLRVYFGTDTRAAEILVGALLALVLVGRAGLRPMGRRLARMVDGAGLVALAASIGLWLQMSEFDSRLYEGGLLAISLLAAVVVAACTLSGGMTARVLGVAPLAALGRISYGVYIFHWPVFLWLSESRVGVDGGWLFAVRMALTLVLAVASYHLVELPIRAGRLVPPRVAPLAWANATVATCALVAAPTVQGAAPTSTLALRAGGDALPDGPAPTVPATATPPPTAAAGTAPAPVAVTTPPSSAATAGGPTTVPAAGAAALAPGTAPAITAAPAPSAASPPVTAPAVPPPVKVMVVGDSLAQNLSTGLTAWAERTGTMVVWDLSIQGCALSRGGVRLLQDGTEWPVEEKCGWWATDQARSRLAEFRPDVVLVQTGHGEIFDRNLPAWGEEYRRPGDPRFDSWLLSEYQAAAEILGSTGARVVWSIPPCIEADRKPGFIENREGNARLRHLGTVMDGALASTRPVTLADLDAEVCPGGQFSDTVFGVANGRPDGWHFTRAAAEAIASHWLAPLLVDAAA